jgi:hypothetical protein
VYAACCLHNFTEERSEAVLRSWILALNSEAIDCDHMANRVPTWSPTTQSARTAKAETMALKIVELKRMGLPWVEESLQLFHIQYFRLFCKVVIFFFET